MSCPICGRMMCDCGPAQRGQTQAEMMDDYYQNGSSSKKTTTPKAKIPPRTRRQRFYQLGIKP